MKQLFNYLFYRGYYFFNKLYGKNDNPYAIAWLFISILFFFTIIAVLNFFPAVARPILIFKDGIFFPALGILILVVFYFLFLFRKRYEKIISIYDSERIPNTVVLLLPLMLFFGVAILYVISLTR